jgi:putative phosphoribosyl transferase
MPDAARAQAVRIDVDQGAIDGDFVLPDAPAGVVVFAHGSGSSRHSPRNRQVAATLHEAGIGTLLLDLLTAEEERVDLETRELSFDIALLAGRLSAATTWLLGQPERAPLGYFGASTGAAAALVAAAELPDVTRAVVSRGGRPDLAGSAALGSVRAPTLLIVGERDPVVLELNLRALDELAVEKELEIVPGATHLFEEPGTLEQVATLARDWFGRWLTLDKTTA